MTEPILQIENLNISFFTRTGDVPAVRDFSCAVMPGESMGLVGESGCGKSTVALGVMGYLGRNGRIVSGSIKFKGKELTKLSDENYRRLRGNEIAMIFQEPMASLNPAMKIGKQLMEVPILHASASDEDAANTALETLTAVNLADPLRIFESYPHQLSGGQQQRAVIAMGLMSKPDLLLLDEPTTALDVTVEAGIVDLIKELAATFGTAMLFVSHNLGLIRDACDRITVMYSGEAVETGSISDVFQTMRHPYTQGLLRTIPTPGADKNTRPLIPIRGQLPLPHQRPPGCNFGPRCEHFKEGFCDTGDIPMEPIPGVDRHYSRCARIGEIDWAAPSPLTAYAASVEPGGVVLHVTDLKKTYEVSANALFGGTRIVRANEGVSLDAREAETVAIVGESGCGKSTFAKVLLGLEASTAGDVRLDGDEIGAVGVADRDSRTVASIQMVFQNPFDTLNPSISVGSQIMRTLKKFGIGSTENERYDRMLELLDLVKLPRAFAARMPRQLSGGEKQRIGIARAFAGRPRIVVADEPVSALDVSVQAAVTELLMDLQRSSRTTLLFISHDLSVVRYLSDRIVVMYLGNVVETGTTDQIFRPPYHPYTEALLSAMPLADTSMEKRRIVLEGDMPSALHPPGGCPFSTRCPKRDSVLDGRCTSDKPPMVELADGHKIACHLSQDVLDAMEPVIELSDVG